jgi:NRAMP (natural resistance-associated macrophage protein)-like metal ion transporter
VSPSEAATSDDPKRPNALRVLGLGLITGAADDDPSAIGTYASAGAKFGPGLLWTAPVTFPMMFAVVYLSAKLGQVSGRGLFAVIRDHYSPWILRATLVGVLIGNTIEAAADIGGMAAALGLLVPLPRAVIVIGTTVTIFGLQLWGSYRLIRNVFRWLALTLLAYGGAAVLAKPDLREVLIGTFVPRIRFDREFLSLLVAIIGTTLSAYLYTWQSNEEVEEEIEMGRTKLRQRLDASPSELSSTRRDVLVGMFFSNIVMYFIILATGSTLYEAGVHDIHTAAEAARALRPLVGGGAEFLFALGVVGVGFLAVPVMTTGAAYDLCQTLGWKHGLGMKPREAKRFYVTIGVFTAIAMGMNFLGINPMKALVFSGIVQGFSTPPLLLLILLMTNNRAIMGDKVNTLGINLLGFVTVVAIFAASLGLLLTLFL